MDPSSRPSGDWSSSVLFAESYPLSQQETFYQTEMATTVGATLTSSKLAVTQGDLHHVGSSVDQLIVQFDQSAFDEFLAADRIKTNKAKKRCYKARAAASQLTSAAPS